jgi:hypothetical protein
VCPPSHRDPTGRFRANLSTAITQLAGGKHPGHAARGRLAELLTYARWQLDPDPGVDHAIPPLVTAAMHSSVRECLEVSRQGPRIGTVELVVDNLVHPDVKLCLLARRARALAAARAGLDALGGPHPDLAAIAKVGRGKGGSGVGAG